MVSMSRMRMLTALVATATVCTVVALLDPSGSGAASPSHPAVTAAAPSSSFQFLDVGTGKCLSPAGGSSSPNATIVQYLCDTNTARRFTLINNGSSFKLKDNSSGLCLSPAGGSTGLNAAIVQYYCDNDQARTWTLVRSTNTGSFFVQNGHSGLCLAIAGASTANNATAVQYYCDSDPSRRFFLAYQPF